MNRSTVTGIFLVCLAMSPPLPGGPGPDGPSIFKEVEVAAPAAEVWNAWTTEGGAQTFFAPAANIDATVGGHYEIYFFPGQPYGWRGADGNRVHDLVPGKLLAFTWNAPTDFGVLRNLHTLVFVRLEGLDSGRTKVTLTQLGFGESPEWLKLRDYFVRAWDVVLSRLKYRFEHGPVDWNHPPSAAKEESGERTAP